MHYTDDHVVLPEGIVFDIRSSTFYLNGMTLQDKVDAVSIRNAMIKTMLKERDTIVETTMDPKEITMLNIVPTMVCDGRCTYCYAEDNVNLQITPDLTVETIHSQLQQLKDSGYTLNIKNIRFYGGEPFQCPNICQLVVFLYNEFPDALFYISTGLLMNEDTFLHTKFVCDVWTNMRINFYLGVTVDFGLTEDKFTRKNINRLTRRDIIRRASLLEKHDCSIRYVTVLTKDTDPDLLFTQLIEHYESKKDINTTMTTIGEKQLTYRICCAAHTELYPSVDILDKVANKMLELYDLPITSNLFPYTDVVYGAQVVCLDKDQYTLAYPNMYCRIFHGLITLTPSGMTACHMSPYDNTLEPSNEEKYLLKDPECRACSFFLMCRGGCIKRKVFISQCPEAREAHCVWTKYSYILGIWRLWKLYPSKEQFLGMLLSHINRNQLSL